MKMDFLKKIYEIYPTLTRAERLVADYFAEHSASIPPMPLKAICRAAGVSEPTVFRFCRAMGFAGIKDIKLYMASHLHDASPAAPEEAKPNGTYEFVSRILEAEQKILSVTIRHLDPVLLEEAASHIASAGRIFLYGLGSSFLVCQDAARKLTRMQMNAWAIQEPDELKTHLHMSRSPALLFCISHSGSSRPVISALQTARSLQIPTLLMTSYPHSAAARYADWVLQTYAVEEISSRVGMTSRISQFAVLDALILTIAHLSEGELFLKMDQNSRLVLEESPQEL